MPRMDEQGEDDATPAAESRGQAELSSRDKAIWAGVALFLLASLVVGIVVLADGSDDDDLQAADGVLVEAEDDRLRIDLSQPIDGRDQLELAVQPADRAQLDIPHLRQHARARLPTRVYYGRDGDGYVARRAEDLPSLP